MGRRLATARWPLASIDFPGRFWDNPRHFDGPARARRPVWRTSPSAPSTSPPSPRSRRARCRTSTSRAPSRSSAPAASRKRVKAEIRLKSFPQPDWSFGVLAGIEEAAALLEGLPVDVWAMDEGTLFGPTSRCSSSRAPTSSGREYETALLGLLCQASGIATKAARCKRAAGERQVISFGARRMHPALAPDDRAQRLHRRLRRRRRHQVGRADRRRSRRAPSPTPSC